MAFLCREIQAGAGALLFTDEALSQRNVRMLLEALANEPPWSDISLIIFTQRPGVAGTPLFTDEILDQLGNVTFLERPIRLQTLISAVKAGLRARRGQYEVRDLLREKEKAARRLDLVAEIATLLLLAEKPAEIVHRVFNKISVQLGLEIYFNYLVDEREKKLWLTGYGGISRDLAAPLQGLALGEQIRGIAAEKAQSIVFERVQAREDPESAWVRNLGVTAYACFPLIAGGRFIGALSFGTRQRDRFHPDELSLMETVCNQVAVAIERQRTEEALCELNQALELRVEERTAQLRESMDNMEAFSYTISHDLRAPLRVIRGFSQALLEDYRVVLDGTGADYLDRIGQGAERMDRLIQDLLAYSRVGRAKVTLEPVHLEGCLLNALREMEEDIQSKQAEVLVAEPLPRVLGHPPTLEQTFINLISNGLKFVGASVKPRIRIRGEDRGLCARIWIEDNGIGIAPQHHQRIFGVFERLHGAETFPGTGIGLAIVVKAITRMNGTVGVESELGQGSRFWIELPKACAG